MDTTETLDSYNLNLAFILITFYQNFFNANRFL